MKHISNMHFIVTLLLAYISKIRMVFVSVKLSLQKLLVL